MSTHTPAIADLTPLIGTWRMDAVFPDGRQGPPQDTGARTVFEHGPDAAFVIQRWVVPHPAAPDGIAMITVDPERGGFLQHYFDSRGVVRLLSDDVWSRRVDVGADRGGLLGARLRPAMGGRALG